MLSSRPLGLPTDGVLFPAKTPGRSLKNRSENAYAGTMTVNGKGKNGPKTPFHPSSVQPHRLFKDQKTLLTTAGRPLGDKTPMPNRIGVVLFKTPLPGNHKLSKLKDDKGQETNDSPGSAQRPSSMRKHIKHPRFSGKALETPANVGKHWDISDEEIVLDVQPVQQETILEQEDDLDELEYGPPNTLGIPDEPYFGFDLPNYTDVGKTLFELAHSHHYEEVVPPVEIEISPSAFENAKWDMVPLPDIVSDDPFTSVRMEDKPKPVPVPLHLRSKQSATNVKPRSHSSLATVTSSRPSTRTDKVPSSNLGRRLPAPAPKASKSSVTTTSTTAGSTRRVVPLSSKAGKPSIAAPSTARRPHTSLATTRAQKKGAVDDGLFLIKDDGLENELDFKFEI